MSEFNPELMMKMLEQSEKFQQKVDKHLVSLGDQVHAIQMTLAAMQAVDSEARIKSLEDKIGVIEKAQSGRDGGIRLLGKLPMWTGWLAAIAIAFWEYASYKLGVK